MAKRDGRFGMIVPNKFFHTKAATRLRDFLAETEATATRLLTLAIHKSFRGLQTTAALSLWSRMRASLFDTSAPRLGYEILEEVAIPTIESLGRALAF